MSGISQALGSLRLILLLPSQRYYINLILIHQQFAQFASLDPLNELDTSTGIRHANGEVSSRLCKMTRVLCLVYAVTLTRILKIYHEKCGGHRMVFQAVGHVEIAANTLLNCLVHFKDTQKQQKANASLEDLVMILQSLGTLYPVANASLRSLRRALTRRRQGVAFVSSLPHFSDQLPNADSGRETLTWTVATDSMAVGQFATSNDLNALPTLQSLSKNQQPPLVCTTTPIEPYVSKGSQVASLTIDGRTNENGEGKYPSVDEPGAFSPPLSLQVDSVITSSMEDAVPNIQDAGTDTSQFLCFDAGIDDNLFLAEELVDFDAEVNEDIDLDIDSLFPQVFWQTKQALGAFPLAIDSPTGISPQINVF